MSSSSWTACFVNSFLKACQGPNIASVVGAVCTTRVSQFLQTSTKYIRIFAQKLESVFKYKIQKDIKDITPYIENNIKLRE